MTIQEAKRELTEYIQEKKYLDGKRQDLIAYRTRIENITPPPLSDMPKGTTNPKRFETDIAYLLDLEEAHRVLYIQRNKKKPSRMRNYHFFKESSHE